MRRQRWLDGLLRDWGAVAACGQLCLGCFDVYWRCSWGDTHEAGNVVTHVVLELVLTNTETLWRLMTQHFEVGQPHARVIWWRVGPKHQPVARHFLGELDDPRLQQPSRLAIDVGVSP